MNASKKFVGNPGHDAIQTNHITSQIQSFPSSSYSTPPLTALLSQISTTPAFQSNKRKLVPPPKHYPLLQPAPSRYVQQRSKQQEISSGNVSTSRVDSTGSIATTVTTTKSIKQSHPKSALNSSQRIQPKQQPNHPNEEEASKKAEMINASLTSSAQLTSIPESYSPVPIPTRRDPHPQVASLFPDYYAAQPPYVNYQY